MCETVCFSVWSEQPAEMNLTDIVNLCKTSPDFETFIRYNQRSLDDRLTLAVMTQGQSISKHWKLNRLFRITASKCSEIVAFLQTGPTEERLREKATKLYNDHIRSHNWITCNIAESACHIHALKYGLRNESTARKLYLSRNKHLTCTETGLLTSNTGALGASPDGILFRNPQHASKFSTWCEGEILEIKCPYKCRDTKGTDPSDARAKIVNELAYLKWNGDEIELNMCNAQGRNYFNQVQMQMHILGSFRCHFVIWTPHTMFSFPVAYNPEWRYVAELLTTFWSNYLMPCLWENMQRLKQEDPAIKNPFSAAACQ